ncbi:MAG: pilus assembly protein [Kiritimatiellae bacterium]|nr:pilus assembly protein [Kiritimatiellia bacterium]
MAHDTYLYCGKAGRSSAGSVMLEFVLAFPVILTLILACMQFAHMWTARQVVQYAAFCAARAALVCESGEYQEAGRQAAEQVCAWIVLGKNAGEQDKKIPGWGVIPGSGAVKRKTKVKMEQIGSWNVKATVTHDFAMVFPLVGPMIGWGADPWARSQRYLERHADSSGNIGAGDTVKWPHVRFTETAVLTKPYVTLPKTGIPVSGW